MTARRVRTFFQHRRATTRSRSPRRMPCRQSTPQSLTYAAFFSPPYLAAHLATRYAVPFADPYLLPIAGLLTAIGLTEIYRLNPTDAFRQGIWIVVAVALFAATLFLLRHDYRRLE